MRAKHIVIVGLTILGLGSMGPVWTHSDAEAANYNRGARYRTRAMLPAGTSFNVELNSKISSDDSHAGDVWTGTVTQSVYSNDRIVIPAGSPVTGVVTSAAQGTHNTRAQLGLAVREVTANGETYRLNADTQPIVAGTSRAKKIGAVALGAAGGALLGHTVAKDHHGTLIGGLVGGAAGYGLTRNALRTLQLKPGTELTFTAQEAMAVRR